jgi:hypothetical protein
MAVFDELSRARIMVVSCFDAWDITLMLLSYTIEVQHEFVCVHLLLFRFGDCVQSL